MESTRWSSIRLAPTMTVSTGIVTEFIATIVREAHSDDGIRAREALGLVRHRLSSEPEFRHERNIRVPFTANFIYTAGIRVYGE